MNPNQFKVNHWLIGLTLSLGISLAAKWMDFPRIHIDDLYFIQTAATYKNEGRLDNTAFTSEYREGLTLNRNFGQLPFYSYAMSIWMELFGLSGVSLQAFFLFFLFLGVASVMDLSRIIGVSLPFSCFIAGIFALSLSLFGFRMDIISLFLFFFGWRVLFFGKPWAYFGGVGIFACSAAVYPSGFFFGLPVFSYLYFRDIIRPRLFWSGLNLWILGSVMFWASFFALLLGYLIQGDWRGFISDYRISANQANPGMFFSINKFYLSWVCGTDSSLLFPKMGFVIFAFLLAGMLPWYSRRLHRPVTTITPCCLLGLGIFLNAGVVPLKFRLFAACSVVIAGWSLSEFFRISPNTKFRLFSSCALLLFGAMAVPGITYGLIQSAPKSYDLVPVIQGLQRKGYVVLIDSNAAKFGLDWRLPRGVYDFQTSRSILDPDPLKRIVPKKFSDLHDNEIAVLSWNDSLVVLTGRRLLASFGPFRLPVSSTKSDVFFVSRNGVLGSVYEFRPQDLPLLK